jgi:hypothetical protein
LQIGNKMRIQRFETKVNASAYTTDTARRQLTSIQARYNDLTSLQTKLLASNRLTASFTQNSLRDLMEMVAPVPVVYTTAKLITAVKVAKKGDTPKAAKAPKKQSDAKALFEQMKQAGAFDKNTTDAPKPTGGAKATKGKSDAEAIRKLMESADPLTKAMSKKPAAAETTPAPKVPARTEPKVTPEYALELVDNFARALDDAGEDDSTADIIDSARTRVESLDLGKLSPKLVAVQRSVLEKLGSVKTRGKLESFLATEAENLRSAIKKFAEEQAPAKADPETEVVVYNKDKFLELLDVIESAEVDAAEPGAKLKNIKTLIIASLEEMLQEAFDFATGDIEDRIEEFKTAIDNTSTLKDVVSVSSSGRKALESFVSEQTKKKLFKDSGKQEQTKVDNKDAAKEQARKELEQVKRVVSRLPKALSKEYIQNNVLSALDRIITYVPGLKPLADLFNTELSKQRVPTHKLLKSLGLTLVNNAIDYLDAPDGDVETEDEPVETEDEPLVEDPNDFSVDDATTDEPTGFEFSEDDDSTAPTTPAAKPDGKTGFELDDEPAEAPPATKAPRRVLDDDIEETPESTTAPTSPTTPAVPETKSTTKKQTSKPVKAPAAKPTAPAAPPVPPITEQQAAKPTPGQFDVSGQDGELQLKPTSVKLDPANKQLIQKHQAIAKDLNSLFYELQTVSARVKTSLVDSVAPKTIEAIQSSLGRLGEQVKISMLASLKAIREMTAAHIPKQFADTVQNLNKLLVKTIPTKIPPAIHTFMFIDEDDELCFTSYIVLTRPTDKQGRTIPRLFIYLTYRTQKHKMYVCTSRNMLPLSEDLFRMPFTNPKTMALGLDRLLNLDNFHANLAKVDLRTVFGKGGVESAKIINDFPAIASIEQDGDELVFALSDSIGEDQEAIVERQANQLENRFKLSIGKKFRIFKTYKFVNTAINPEDVYEDPADNKTAEPKVVNKPTPHYEIRLSFTAVPGQEPITTADLDFLKDRFIKLNDDSIRRMVRIANDS